MEEEKKEKEKEQGKGVSRRGFIQSVAISGAALGVNVAGLTKSAKAETTICKQNISLTINGQAHVLEIGDQPDEILPSDTLADTLREKLRLTGTKIACDHGTCGLCTVLMDNRPVLSCSLLTVECDGKNIVTIEGLQNEITGQLDPLQQSFIDNTAFQCGFCTPGIIMSAKGLLIKNSNPDETEVKEALSGNHCRCGSHYMAVEAVMKVAGKGR